MDSTLLAFERERYKTDASYDKAINNHIGKINELFKAEATAIIANAPTLLKIVNPTEHSISHLAILNTLKLSALSDRSIPSDDFHEYILRFLLSFDPRQIRYVGDVFLHLLQDVLDCKFFPARQAIQIIAIVLGRLDPDFAVLTSTHFAAVKLAYETENFDEALPIIDHPWVFLPTMKNQDTPTYLCDLTASPAAYVNTATQLSYPLSREDVMQYEFWSAQIFTAKRKWADAHKAYKRVITWPASDGHLSKIMVESHKRWVLTGLLAFGHTPTQPTQVGSAAAKSLTLTSKPYLDVAALFSTNNVEQFKADVTKHVETWNADQTSTLLQEVIEAYQKWQILGLADVYHKISIPEIRQTTLSAETGQILTTDQQVEELLQAMHAGGMLAGDLETGPDGTTYLTFLPRDEEMDYGVYQKKINDDARLKSLSKWTKASDSRLAASRDYAKHIIREQKRSDKDGSSQLGPEYNLEEAIEDEDLMTGIQHP
ncbi:COP9 signalosome complex subunit 3 [Colletotrichum trifolii]|uniref:COP9 signalosome complex subunit 3 n=1 Tax=Colletotrichum trifolii TaxID=5466 RepID=A0A4R8R0E2_COLTR|nr:COP9 signalosome complex subunit 3 [Colletotrichum trifolii]